ncbi:ATP-binding protein [Novosphingobium sp.]|uniref:ATP-binding protein n=1 Tax=Novosphingobium sp. TaxID=1874826 RepID=UPI0025FC0B9C|nr:ATP-binding protein [Novosphingobium sp.]
MTPLSRSWRLRGGETGRLIADRDWSDTPLGPINQWPPSLNTALAVLLLSPVPIVMLWGTDGIMLYNDAYSLFAGGRHPDLLGSKVREGWPEVADFNDHVMKVGLAGGTLAFRNHELTLWRNGVPEQVWMNLDYSPILDESGQPAGVIAFVVETTGAHRAEQELLSEREALRVLNAKVTAIALENANLIQEARLANETLEQRVEQRTAELTEAHEALRQAQKMEAVGQLTGGIAHDFNNLLAGISGSLELIERRLIGGRSDGLERFIVGAQASAKRATALTQRLLAFSRRQTLDPKPVDANRLIHGIEDLMRRTIGPAITLEVVGAGGLWTTRVDPAQLESALINLAINARDAMPEGGRITIETANKWLDARAAPERDLAPGQYISICVTDTGTGIPKDVIDRIFDPFFTTKPIGKGTGLGLSMVHGFVRQSGGQVRVYSETGEGEGPQVNSPRGTTMCLYLPRYVGAAVVEVSAPGPVVAVQGSGRTVLVIDDEPMVRMLIVEVLEEAGFRSLEAEDGPSGLKLLDQEPGIDLLVTDVGLPGGMNGRQVADAARQSRPDLKVLFVTGYAENAAVGNGLLDPGMEIITKPFGMTELAAKITEMIES